MIMHYQFAKRWEHLELDYTSHDGMGMSWRMIRIKYDLLVATIFSNYVCIVFMQRTQVYKPD